MQKIAGIAIFCLRPALKWKALLVGQTAVAKKGRSVNESLQITYDCPVYIDNGWGKLLKCRVYKRAHL